MTSCSKGLDTAGLVQTEVAAEVLALGKGVEGQLFPAEVERQIYLVEAEEQLCLVEVEEVAEVTAYRKTFVVWV
jgi:hypothetical protein